MSVELFRDFVPVAPASSEVIFRHQNVIEPARLDSHGIPTI